MAPLTVKGPLAVITEIFPEPLVVILPTVKLPFAVPVKLKFILLTMTLLTFSVVDVDVIVYAAIPIPLSKPIVWVEFTLADTIRFDRIPDGDPCFKYTWSFSHEVKMRPVFMPDMPIYKLPPALEPIFPQVVINAIPAPALSVWILDVPAVRLEPVVSKIDPAAEVILIALFVMVVALKDDDPEIKALAPKYTLRPAVRVMIP